MIKSLGVLIYKIQRFSCSSILYRICNYMFLLILPYAFIHLLLQENLFNSIIFYIFLSFVYFFFVIMFSFWRVNWYYSKHARYEKKESLILLFISLYLVVVFFYKNGVFLYFLFNIILFIKKVKFFFLNEDFYYIREELELVYVFSDIMNFKLFQPSINQLSQIFFSKLYLFFTIIIQGDSRYFYTLSEVNDLYLEFEKLKESHYIYLYEQDQLRRQSIWTIWAHKYEMYMRWLLNRPKLYIVGDKYLLEWKLHKTPVVETFYYSHFSILYFFFYLYSLKLYSFLF